MDNLRSNAILHTLHRRLKKKKQTIKFTLLMFAPVFIQSVIITLVNSMIALIHLINPYPVDKDV